MHVHQFQHEYQVTTIIDTYHRSAVQAEQLRLAHPNQPVRSFVRSLFSSIRQALVQQPVARPELVTVPSDTALIA